MMSAIPVMSLSGEVYYPVLKMGTLKLREVKASPKTSRFRTVTHAPNLQEAPRLVGGRASLASLALLCVGDVS